VYLSIFRISNPFRSLLGVALPFALATGLAVSAAAQRESSSSSPQPAPEQSLPTPRVALPDVGGSAVTLEDSEPLFYLAVALNTCGYDADLANSSPVRQKVRDEVNAALADSAEARDRRDELCGYIRSHTLNDPGLNLAQYISLALNLSPPPQLEPTVDQTQMPPDSTAVVNILPLLRSFAAAVHMNAIRAKYRPDYQALLGQIHDPMQKMVMDTNIYLHLPISSYDGRRFMVLMEPMLAPAATNARIYGSDYIVVVSPSVEPAPGETVPVRMNDIRHTYLHYLVEPLVYSKSMDLLQPLLKTVQDAPLEFIYRSDAAALVNECLIKAIEIHMTDVGLPKPRRPEQIKQRVETERYLIEMGEYERQAEVIRRKNVDLAVRQGWVLVDYFYGKIGQMVKDGVSLREDIGEMVYGMDVGREVRAAKQVDFLPEGTRDIVSHAPRQLSGMAQAEIKLAKGDLDGATAQARAALADPKADHARAHFLIARVAVMQSDYDDALSNFEEVLKTSKDPGTVAWTHIYLGRLYDLQSVDDPPLRDKALEEYRTALANRDSRPETKAAAEQGIKHPFAAPVRKAAPDDDDEPLDPSGKAQKDAYRPPPHP